jgi:DNA-binding CsgD family transcriptional regulator
MQRTLLSDYSELLLSIYRLAQESPVDEFQDRVLEALKLCLPFDSSMWGTARMTDEGIDIHTLHLHNTTPAMIEAYEKVKHLDVAAAAITRLPRQTMSWNTERDFPAPELQTFRDFLHTFRHENVFISSDIHPITRFTQWVSLYRGSKTQYCTPQEEELLACIAPHLMQALAINRLVHLDRLTGDATREVWAVAIADSRGVLYHADAQFLALLQREWPLTEAGALSSTMLHALRDADNYLTGQYVVVRANTERELLFLKVRERALIDNLTPREYLIASLLNSGMSQKEVAVKLERSLETIRSHAKTIFTKLGITKLAMLGPFLALRE